MSTRRTIIYKTSFDGYNAGEKRTTDADICENRVKRGIAKYAATQPQAVDKAVKSPPSDTSIRQAPKAEQRQALADAAKESADAFEKMDRSEMHELIKERHPDEADWSMSADQMRAVLRRD